MSLYNSTNNERRTAKNILHIRQVLFGKTLLLTKSFV